MKRLILASALVSTTALADPFIIAQVIIPPLMYEAYREDKAPAQKDPVTVLATGVGKTCEQALDNAKVVAVEKVAGLWLTAERNTDGKKYNEKITDYTGGVISSYTIVDNQCTKVTIEAKVVPRTNKIVTGGADVSRETRNHLQEKLYNEQKRLLAIKEVDNRSTAIYFKIKDIELTPQWMMFTGDMGFQEKWKQDYYDLKKHAGKFNLDSFDKPIFVNVKGYENGREVYNQKFQLNYDVKLFGVRDNGEVVIYPDRKDRIKLTFPVDSGKIMAVDKFEVTIL